MDRIFKSVLFIAFLILMAAVLDFRLSLIVNIPMFLYVVVGTAILTFFFMKNGQDRYHLVVRIRINLFITGMMVMFLSQLVSVTSLEKLGQMETVIIKNFLPLFYAMILIVLMDILPNETTETEIVGGKDNSRLELTHLTLTKREWVVAQILFEELTNKEIGEELSISENTVKKHVYNIYKKANVKNRTEFINKYYMTRKGD